MRPPDCPDGGHHRVLVQAGNRSLAAQASGHEVARNAPRIDKPADNERHDADNHSAQQRVQEPVDLEVDPSDAVCDPVCQGKQDCVDEDGKEAEREERERNGQHLQGWLDQRIQQAENSRDDQCALQPFQMDSGQELSRNPYGQRKDEPGKTTGRYSRNRALTWLPTSKLLAGTIGLQTHIARSLQPRRRSEKKWGLWLPQRF